MIPADWEVRTLREVCRQIVDGTHFTPTYTREGVPFYSVENVTANDFKHVKFISSKDHELQNKRCNPERGDILMTRIGSLADTRFIDWDVKASIYVSLALLKVGESIDPRFLYAYSRSQVFRQSVENRSLMSAVPKKINMGAIGDVPVPVPPSNAEQAAIAEALSDVDEAIAAADALIAKKRALKTATMQALLSGTRRLPGFSGKWEQYTFGQLFQFLRNGSSARAALSANGAIGYIHYGDIHAAARPHLDCSRGALPRIAREVVNRLPCVQNGDLLIADASEDYEGTGKSVEATNIGEDEVVAGLHTLLLRPVKKMAPGFAGYLQFIPEVKRQYIAAAQGVSVYGLSRSAVKAVEVSIPQYEEQEAISSCLIDMEIDLTHQTDKLNKLRRLKIGMMQQLLTGKIRLA